jgi:hypothetical protein
MDTVKPIRSNLKYWQHFAADRCLQVITNVIFLPGVSPRNRGPYNPCSKKGTEEEPSDLKRMWFLLREGPTWKGVSCQKRIPKKKEGLGKGKS